MTFVAYCAAVIFLLNIAASTYMIDKVRRPITEWGCFLSILFQIPALLLAGRVLGWW